MCFIYIIYTDLINNYDIYNVIFQIFCNLFYSIKSRKSYNRCHKLHVLIWKRNDGIVNRAMNLNGGKLEWNFYYRRRASSLFCFTRSAGINPSHPLLCSLVPLMCWLKLLVFLWLPIRFRYRKVDVERLNCNGCLFQLVCVWLELIT